MFSHINLLEIVATEALACDWTGVHFDVILMLHLSNFANAHVSQEKCSKNKCSFKFLYMNVPLYVLYFYIHTLWEKNVYPTEP